MPALKPRRLQTGSQPLLGIERLDTRAASTALHANGSGPELHLERDTWTLPVADLQPSHARQTHQRGTRSWREIQRHCLDTTLAGRLRATLRRCWRAALGLLAPGHSGDCERDYRRREDSLAPCPHDSLYDRRHTHGPGARYRFRLARQRRSCPVALVGDDWGCAARRPCRHRSGRVRALSTAACRQPFAGTASGWESAVVPLLRFLPVPPRAYVNRGDVRRVAAAAARSAICRAHEPS
jgi:hypothetical protein